MPHYSNIAIVDDDEAIRGAMEALLESCGYKGVSFVSALEFLQYAEHSTFGCILSDIKMPGMDGIQLLAALNNEASRPPIIFMTSFADLRIKSTAMRNGALAYLGKPVEVADLLTWVEKAMGPPHEVAVI